MSKSGINWFKYCIFWRETEICLSIYRILLVKSAAPTLKISPRIYDVREEMYATPSNIMARNFWAAAVILESIFSR
jgi:hypothetical protein